MARRLKLGLINRPIIRVTSSSVQGGSDPFGLSFSAPLISSLAVGYSLGSPTPTFARATTAYVWGYAADAVIADGPILLSVASGEARFMGARRVSEGVWSIADANGVPLSTTFGASSLYGDASGPFGYLAEGARINRCLYSQTFENAAWVSGGGGITAADNTAVAPDGTSTATTLTATGANGTLIQDLGVVASASKTGGLWIKRKTGTGNIDLTMDGGTGWTTKTVTADWTLIQKNQTLANEDFGIRIVTDTDAVYVWNGQVETAAFLSSPIPTTTIAVARNADVLTYPTAGNTNSSTGAAYCEVKILELNSRILIDAGVTGPLAPASGQPRYSDGTNYPNSGLGNISSDVLAKVACSWGGATGKMFLNGAAGTATAFDGGMFTTSPLGVGDATVPMYGTIRNLRFYNRALSDAELQAMTS